jgi:hypothetical protein
VPIRTYSKNLAEKSCLWRIVFHKKSGLRRIFFTQIFLKQGCIWLEISYSVYQFIGGENDSNSNIEWSQRHSLYQTVIKKVSKQILCQIKPLEIQIAQHHFNSKTVYKKQRTAGGMPHLKPTDFDLTKHSDYFVWKDTSERVARRCDDTVDKKRVKSCTITTLFGESWATKIS